MTALISTLQGEIGWVKLNRPKVHNAINLQMWSELPAVYQQLISDGARIIVISGADSSFASGADLSELAQLKDYNQSEQYWTSISHCLDYLTRIPIATIAMIDGSCLGGGLLLATSCDLRYATPRSVFGIPVARLGIVLDDERINRLSTVCGIALAKELILTGEIISSARAESQGLVNQIFSVNGIRQEVIEIANQILKNSSTSLSKAKESFQRITSAQNLDTSTKEAIESYLSHDFRERVIRNL